MADDDSKRFKSLGEAARDVTFLVRNTRAMLGVGCHKLDPAFKERIMLAVTSVNRCRYCSFVHTRAALVEGMSRDEIKTLLAGDVDDAPEEELEALMYAQHWADSRGNPAEDARARLLEVYGEERAAAIEVTIRAIMFGNYFGNSCDAALNVLSGGKVGGREE